MTLLEKAQLRLLEILGVNDIDEFNPAKNANINHLIAAKQYYIGVLERQSEVLKEAQKRALMTEYKKTYVESKGIVDFRGTLGASGRPLTEADAKHSTRASEDYRIAWEEYSEAVVEFESAKNLYFLYRSRIEDIAQIISVVKGELPFARTKD